MSARAALARIARLAVTQEGESAGHRFVAEEVPIAFSFGGTSRGVMMATPADLDDFAYGFCLSEDLIVSASDVLEIAACDVEGGIDLQIRLAPQKMAAVKAHARQIAGPVGCGLCGVESIEEALRGVPPVRSELRLSGTQVAAAVKVLSAHQTLNQKTRAVHAAGFFTPSEGLVSVREDVGRHNALDKLAGHLLRQGADAGAGAIVLSSRVSVELVQKAARMGCPVLIAVSAPTALALRVAEAANITIAAVVRGDEFEIFTHPERISGRSRAHVA